MIAHSLCSRCTATNSSVSRAQLTFGKAVSSTGIATKPTTKVAARASFEVIAGKMKTRKSAAKRYKVTASGKVLHRRPGKAHLNGPKTSERKARLSIEATVGTSQLSLVRACLPYARL
mmetsp:Transcript_2928/g.10610  ORF Transcript_2928/g.10610 Transcript_2928/m.10610 type:complete len:118 (-) Transcript_2928:388-741(-)